MEFSYLLSYIGGSITFIIVTFCGEFLFSLNYKRKDKFVLRYSLSLLITVSLSVALTIPYYIVDVIYKEIVWSNIVVIVLYLSMFTLTVIAINFVTTNHLLPAFYQGLPVTPPSIFFMVLIQ